MPPPLGLAAAFPQGEGDDVTLRPRRPMNQRTIAGHAATIVHPAVKKSAASVAEKWMLWRTVSNEVVAPQSGARNTLVTAPADKPRLAAIQATKAPPIKAGKRMRG